MILDLRGTHETAAAWPLAVRAQQPDRVRRVGVLMPQAADGAVISNLQSRCPEETSIRTEESCMSETALDRAEEIKRVGYTIFRNFLPEELAQIIDRWIMYHDEHELDDDLIVLGELIRKHYPKPEEVSS